MNYALIAAQLAPTINTILGAKVGKVHSLGNMFSGYAIAAHEMSANLTWRGRFSKAVAVLYNFWSSGDEVLEVAGTSG